MLSMLILSMQGFIKGVYRRSKLNLKLIFEIQFFKPKISISTIAFLRSLLVYCSQDYTLKTSVMVIIKQPHSNKENGSKCICVVCTEM